MKSLLLIAAALLATVSNFSQKAVLLHKTNGTQQAFYSNQPLNDAYNAAGAGDTVYIPGGFFSGLHIYKRLFIYGAGHYPDSTQATGTTVITNYLTVQDEADSTLLEGLHINTGLDIAAGANYVKVRRNRIESGISVIGNNCQIEANVILGNVQSNSTPLQVLITNNIIQGSITGFSNGALFRNNIFLTDWRVLAYPHSTYVVFENNIFIGTNPEWNYGGGSVYNTFTKNVFNINPDFTNNTASGNYTNASNVFVNQTGNAFNYGHNYHLQNPANYQGVDATQCGIYGGLFGYKEGAVPANPHIISKTISATTDGSGKLNATIKVAAQNN
jgi:hypothetical protein